MATCPQRAPKNPNPVCGERHYRAKLTETDARLILEAHASGLSTRVLADKFDVSQSCVARLVSARNWKHL